MMISHSRINLSMPIERWQQEIKSLPDLWSSHFNHMNYEGDWTVLPLRSPGGRIERIIPDLIGNEDYADTALLESCPAVNQWLKLFECPLMSVRLLNLKAGSYIKEHRDYGLSFESGEARLHVPVFTNNYVAFYLNNVLLQMKEGECWYINANLPHHVANNGDCDRIHLVIDCKVNDWLEQLFSQSDRTFVPRQQSNSDLIKVIKELRLQNSENGNRIADELEKTLAE
jgi:hypothetical protein